MGDFEIKRPTTKTVVAMLKKIEADRALIVDSSNDKLYRSVRNISKTKYIDVRGLNVFDILKYDNVFLTKESLKQIEERLAS
jgi:large subunit ribosomal protein L4